MSLVKTPCEIRYKRRELLIETSKRRLDRLRDKLKLVRKKLLVCEDGDKSRWSKAERELSQSVEQEQLRIDRLEAELPEAPAWTPDPPAAANLELETSQRETLLLARQVTTLEEAFRELESRHNESLAQLAKARQELESGDVNAVRDEVCHELEGVMAEREEFYRRVAQEEEQKCALLHEKLDLEQALADSQELLQEELHNLEIELRETQARRDQLSAELEASLQSNEDLRNRLQEEIQATHELLEETLQEKDLEVEDLTRRLAAEKAARQALESANAQREDSHLFDLLAEQASEIENLHSAVESQEDLLERSEAARRDLEREVLRIKGRLDELVAEHQETAGMREEQARLVGVLAAPLEPEEAPRPRPG